LAVLCSLKRHLTLTMSDTCNYCNHCDPAHNIHKKSAGRPKYECETSHARDSASKSCDSLCHWENSTSSRSLSAIRRADRRLQPTNGITWIDFMQTLPIWREKVRGYLNLRKCKIPYWDTPKNVIISKSQFASWFRSTNRRILPNMIIKAFPERPMKLLGEYCRSKSDCSTIDSFG
jgi:hypothetical protein